MNGQEQSHLVKGLILDLGIAGEAHDWAIARAVKLHRRATRLGKLHQFIAMLQGRPIHIRALERSAKLDAVYSWRYMGIQQVALARIVGSEGHKLAFDPRFYPINGHNRKKWLETALRQALSDRTPLVELVQIESEFYAQTGQYSISVARALGVSHIDAYVTSWEIDGRRIPDRSDNNLDQILRKGLQQYTGQAQPPANVWAAIEARAAGRGMSGRVLPAIRPTL